MRDVKRKRRISFGGVVVGLVLTLSASAAFAGSTGWINSSTSSSNWYQKPGTIWGGASGIVAGEFFSVKAGMAGPTGVDYGYWVSDDDGSTIFYAATPRWFKPRCQISTMGSNVHRYCYYLW